MGRFLHLLWEKTWLPRGTASTNLFLWETGTRNPSSAELPTPEHAAAGKRLKAEATASLASAMDLEIVGRHALLFDDDTTAEVVNSGGSLVPWAAVGASDLLLDRHDVRHLLDRVPPRPRRSYSAVLLSAPSLDGVSEAELDRERFLDLPADDDGTRDAHPSENHTLQKLESGDLSLLSA
ncbi:hypothetical protein PR202_gb05087 [Eleusine coracana subsp. coracana]|uniref:Suppressor of white apricot N-terminal domain-containing protein n=1 Tax=Eleusine coracana subsp. coracana TaxID=191504 RepID=A0AAV5E613_ELECO|nr:hypothetical protein PR202_gb05087 [Eleusine coracana subsp. coracana]